MQAIAEVGSKAVEVRASKSAMPRSQIGTEEQSTSWAFVEKTMPRWMLLAAICVRRTLSVSFGFVRMSKRLHRIARTRHFAGSERMARPRGWPPTSAEVGRHAPKSTAIVTQRSKKCPGLKWRAHEYAVTVMKRLMQRAVPIAQRTLHACSGCANPERLAIDGVG